MEIKNYIGVAILTSDKTDFKTKAVIRDKGQTLHIRYSQSNIYERNIEYLNM